MKKYKMITTHSFDTGRIDRVWRDDDGCSPSCGDVLINIEEYYNLLDKLKKCGFV